MVLLPVLSFLLSWGLFEASLRYVHYLLGALISFILFGIASGFVWGVFETGVGERPAGVGIEEWKKRVAYLKVTNFVKNISGVLAVVFILLCIASWLSYVLIQWGFGGTEIGIDTTYSSLISTYGWHLLDLIPFMHVEKSLGASPAIEFEGWVMAAPIITFRVFVGVVVFAALRRAWVNLMSIYKEKG